MRSQAPEIVDAETVELKRHAGHFYVGLLLASPFPPAHKPVMLVGYRQNGEINVRSQDDYDPAIPSMVRHYPPVTLAELQLAAKIASQIAAIETTPLAGGHWRLFRVQSKLWPHFANTTALQAFWALDDQQKRALWGSTINPTDALADFDPRYISDAQLGGS